MNSNRVYIAIFVTRVYYRPYSLTLRRLIYMALLRFAPRETNAPHKKAVDNAVYIFVFLARPKKESNSTNCSAFGGTLTEW